MWVSKDVVDEGKGKEGGGYGQYKLQAGQYVKALY